MPVTWPFFGICPCDSECYIYPYDLMSVEDCNKQYRLRVMVNVGPNCFHFKYLDDKAFNFFFDQVCVCVYCVYIHVCLCTRVCVCVYVHVCVYMRV